MLSQYTIHLSVTMQLENINIANAKIVKSAAWPYLSLPSPKRKRGRDVKEGDTKMGRNRKEMKCKRNGKLQEGLRSRRKRRQGRDGEERQCRGRRKERD